MRKTFLPLAVAFVAILLSVGCGSSSGGDNETDTYGGRQIKVACPVYATEILFDYNYETEGQGSFMGGYDFGEYILVHQDGAFEIRYSKTRWYGFEIHERAFLRGATADFSIADIIDSVGSRIPEGCNAYILDNCSDCSYAHVYVNNLSSVKYYSSRLFHSTEADAFVKDLAASVGISCSAPDSFGDDRLADYLLEDKTSGDDSIQITVFTDGKFDVAKKIGGVESANHGALTAEAITKLKTEARLHIAQSACKETTLDCDGKISGHAYVKYSDDPRDYDSPLRYKRITEFSCPWVKEGGALDLIEYFNALVEEALAIQPDGDEEDVESDIEDFSSEEDVREEPTDEM